MGDVLVAIDGNWRKHTVDAMYDCISSLYEFWTDGTVCHREQLKSALLTLSKVIWRRFVMHRWIFSWTTSPLNPLAAGAGTFDSVLNSGRSSSGAAAPGEIPGEILDNNLELETLYFVHSFLSSPFPRKEIIILYYFRKRSSLGYVAIWNTLVDISESNKSIIQRIIQTKIRWNSDRQWRVWNSMRNT